VSAPEADNDYRASLEAWRTVSGASGGLPRAIRTCRAHGWAVIHVPGEGFRPCHIDEPGAVVDLDRYAFAAQPDSDLYGSDGDPASPA
jgi:hypothetical protein